MTEEAKHTPGAWRIEEDDFDGFIVIAPRQNCKRHGKPEWAIAKVGSTEFWDESEWRSRDAADARLIAAAPELLQVAQMCLGIVETGILPDWDWIRATIRKATGT